MNSIRQNSKEKLRPLVLALLVASGRSYFCPCCEQHCIKFLPWAGAKGVFCPNCGTHPRHRALFLYLQKYPNFQQRNLKVLHFAPNSSIRKYLSSLSNLDYVTADLNKPSVDIKIDVTKIPYSDNTFDVIFCSHVLEHVPDDRTAMHELFRILKPSGWAFLAVPIGGEKTFEDPNITSPKQRQRHFGQKDHVRLYGLDYKDRLEEAGFTVKAVAVAELLSELTLKQREKYGLGDKELFHFGIKELHG